MRSSPMIRIAVPPDLFVATKPFHAPTFKKKGNYSLIPSFKCHCYQEIYSVSMERFMLCDLSTHELTSIATCVFVYVVVGGGPL